MRKLAVALLFVVAACANAPETMRERLAAADYSYQAALLTLETLVDNGTVHGDAADKAASIVVKAGSALDSAHAAVQGSSSDIQIYITVAIQAVNELIAFVEEYKNAQSSSNYESPAGSYLSSRLWNGCSERNLCLA